MTAEDIPGDNVVSLIAEDQPILVPVGGEIRHQAEPVALLAAADRETLREARRRIRLAHRAAPAGLRPARLETSLRPLRPGARATSRRASRDGGRVVEGTYRVGHQEQLYIENNAMIAVPREDGGVTVHGSLQCPYYVHKALKRGSALELGPGAGHPGGDGRRLRRQGGVPVDDRPPRRAPRPADAAGRCG